MTPPFHITDRTYPAGSRMGSHVHQLPSMSLVLAGVMRESSGHDSDLIGPLSVSLMPSDVAHEDQFGPQGARLLSVHFADPDPFGVARGRGLLDRWRWLHGGPSARLMLRLLEAIRRQNSSEQLEQLVVDALVASTPATPLQPGRPPAWLARVQCAIDDGSKDTVNELARLGQVHRVYLARQFRRFFGCTVSEYMARRRAQRAALDIADSRHSLTTIAHTAGYSDQPHFCHAFRRESGMTPSRYQALVCCAAL